MNQNEEVVFLHLDDIIPNRFQPREVFDEKPLKELAVSIKEHGVIQPIIVRKVNDKYEIIAGERRYKASALAGLTKIPAIIRNLDDKESSKVALLENLQRKNLNAIEEAKTYQKILELDEMTQDELAKTMGKSQSAVANKIRLLGLPDEVQEALMKDQISERHARSLLNIEDPEKQKELLKEIIEKKMNVRTLEEKIKEIKGVSSNTEEITNNEADNSVPEMIPISNSENQDINQQFVSNSPLVPNFDSIPAEDSEPTLIIPPTNTNQPAEPSEDDDTTEEHKFINFGEINDDDDDDDMIDDSTLSYGEEPSPASSSINIESLKKNTSDIGNDIEKTASGVNLDSLLQLNNPPGQKANDSDSGEGEFKFFSPAEQAIKDSEEKEEKDSEDYFKAPELINVDLPEGENTFNTNNVSLADTFNAPEEDDSLKIENGEDKINKAVDMLRDILSKIEETGIKVEKDEINLENSYQIVIKLEK